ASAPAAGSGAGAGSAARTRASGSVRATGLGGGRALLGDQLVGDAQHVLEGAAADAVAAVDQHGGGGVHAAAHHELARAGDLGVHREAVDGAAQLGGVHAVAGQEGDDVVGAGVRAQAALDVHGVEQRGVHAVHGAQRLDGEEGLREVVGGVERGRQQGEAHVGRQALLPRVHQRVEGRAVAAGVGEHFHHLDLAVEGGEGLAARDLDVVGAGDERGARGGGRRGRGGHGLAGGRRFALGGVGGGGIVARGLTCGRGGRRIQRRLVGNRLAGRGRGGLRGGGGGVRGGGRLAAAGGEQQAQEQGGNEQSLGHGSHSMWAGTLGIKGRPRARARPAVR